MSKLYITPNMQYPTNVKAITNLKIMSFHQDVPFFSANLSTIYATPTPNPVPEIIHTKSNTPTCKGENISRNWEPLIKL